MDDELDELFGDTTRLQLPESLPKGLSQRVDELSLGGCGQYVASLSHTGLRSLNVSQEVDVVQKWMHCICHSGWP